jgi:CDP-paratose 2-epimerase
MAYLVTGGCGFVGSNIAAALLEHGNSTVVFDNLSRHGSPENLAWLRSLGEFDFIQADIRDSGEVRRIFSGRSIEAVFHLAGQVAMTTSLQNPRLDFETNVAGTINLLEAVRESAPGAVLVYASSNKVYGELNGLSLMEKETRYMPADGSLAVDESAALDFQTPYGCSKGAADQYVLEYGRNFGLRTVVFRHSTIYGGRQVSTFDQGWIGWFCRQALLQSRDPGHRFTINGNGKQVRDILHVSDVVRCYFAAAERGCEVSGQAFNIGGGPANSMSLLELFSFLEERLNITLKCTQLPWRASDQKFFVADSAKASRLLGWSPKVSLQEGIEEVMEWEKHRLAT